jgi:small subunit ribosomal protein S16
MVRIRLRRVGGKNQASFRIVAADRESPRDGRFIEILGFYNPRTQPATINLKEDRIYHWIGNGAQPSDSAMQIFKSAGLLDRFERFKTGEKVEVLMAEAETAAKSRNTDRLTEHSAPAAGSSKRKLAAKAAAPAATPAAAAAAPAAEAPAAETPKAETPAVETPPAEAPPAETPPAEAPPADEAPPPEAPPAEETPPAE